MLGYVWRAAAGAVGGNDVGRLDRYVRWLRECWQGRVTEVLTEWDAEKQKRYFPMAEVHILRGLGH